MHGSKRAKGLRRNRVGLPANLTDTSKCPYRDGLSGKITMNKSASVGVIRTDEAYAKRELMQRLSISQKFWDKMIAEGLPFTHIGHAKWVTGHAVIEYLDRNAERKNGNKSSK